MRPDENHTSPVEAESVVKGATLQEALANGMALANGIRSVEKTVAKVKEGIRQVTGQIHMEALVELSASVFLSNGFGAGFLAVLPAPAGRAGVGAAASLFSSFTSN